MVPFHCGALLPIDQRFTSPAYRKVCKSFKLRHLTTAEAAELVAFVEFVGVSAAKFLFLWTPAYVRKYQQLTKLDKVVRLAERYRLANEAEIDEQTGYRVLMGMIEGGFKKGRPPAVVRNWLAARRKRGESLDQIAAGLPGISRWQVQEWTYLRPNPVSRRSRSFGLLGVG